MIATPSSGTIEVANWPQLWVTPLTRPRSDFGYQYCIACVPAGQEAASPKPKMKRITTREINPSAWAVATVISDQNRTTSVNTFREPSLSVIHPPGSCPSE